MIVLKLVDWALSFRPIESTVRTLLANLGERIKVLEKARSNHQSEHRGWKGAPLDGFASYLIEIEQKMGGIVTGVPVERVSSSDPRTIFRSDLLPMTGGDRMGPNGHFYSPVYSLVFRHLLVDMPHKEFDGTIVEVGILNGTGLAMWAEVFPNAAIVGLDVDTTTYQKNVNKLAVLSPGVRSASVFEFDQFNPDFEWWETLGRPKISLVIDDGYHSTLSALQTFSGFFENTTFAERWAYIVEDIPAFDSELRSNFPGIHPESFGEITVVRS